MHIDHPHNTTKSEATQKIDSLLDELMQRQFPGNVRIEESHKEWSGDTMNFSFRVKKGILKKTITGTVSVNDQLVVMDMDIPSVITIFVSETKISEVINRQLDKLFDKQNLT